MAPLKAFGILRENLASDFLYFHLWKRVLVFCDVRGVGPHPDGHGHLETTKIKLFHHTHQLLFQQHYQKVIPWDTLGSMPYSWVSEALDFAKTVMDI